MAKKKLLVACGTGVATSVAVARKLENIFQERGLADQVEVSTTTIAELESKAHMYDLIVTTAQYTKPISVKVIQGVAFLIGRGTEPVINDIIKSLNLDESKGG